MSRVAPSYRAQCRAAPAATVRKAAAGGTSALKLRSITLALVFVTAAACTSPGDVLSSPPSPGAEARAQGLARPRVAPADKGGRPYERDQWQPGGWADADGDGCNTREEVLIIESRTAIRPGASCKIVAGEWSDPYTGRTTRAPGALQIDHLVALADANRSGGWSWPPERKVAFANDLEDHEALNAVWGAENQRKADDGPDQ